MVKTKIKLVSADGAYVESDIESPTFEIADLEIAGQGFIRKRVIARELLKDANWGNYTAIGNLVAIVLLSVFSGFGKMAVVGLALLGNGVVVYKFTNKVKYIKAKYQL